MSGRLGHSAASAAQALARARGRVGCWLFRLLVMLAGIAVLGSGNARAQSWLSDAPTTASGMGGPGLVAGAASVPDLLALVGKVDGRDLYPALRSRVGSELAAAPKERAARPKWERDALLALLQLGESQGSAADQESVARAFVDRFPDDDQFPAVFVQLNQALQRQDKPLETSFFFDQAAQASLPPVWLSRWLLIQAAAAERNGDYAAAAEFRLREYDAPGGVHQTQPQDVLDTLERVTDQDTLDRLLAAWARVSWVRDQAPFLKIRAQIHAGRFAQALLALEAIEHQGGGPDEAQQRLILEARNEIRLRAAVRYYRVGVLLPFGSSSSALRELARDTLDGLRLALGGDTAPPVAETVNAAVDYDRESGREGRNRTAAPDSPAFELVIKDTANDPQTAAAAVDALVQSEGVIAIVGPIARAESEAAAARAEERGVPLVSLSLSMDLPQGAQFAFRHSKSQEEEVRDLVLYATDYLNVRRFAVLYPANAYGQRMMQLFASETERDGGTVVAASQFTPWNVKAQQGEKQPVGLKEIFESFVGQDRPLTPSDRALLEAVNDPRPDPIVDFDALFIPLGPNAGQDLRLIAPYPVTVDAENVQLLGTRFWNDDAVLVASGGKLDGAIFADIYDRFSGQPRVAAFQARYHSWYGHRARYSPPSYYSAVGFDTLNLIMDRLRDPANRSREALARALKAGNPYSGVTGLTAFRVSGEASKETVFFKVRGNEFLRQMP